MAMVRCLEQFDPVVLMKLHGRSFPVTAVGGAIAGAVGLALADLGGDLLDPHPVKMFDGGLDLRLAGRHGHLEAVTVDRLAAAPAVLDDALGFPSRFLSNQRSLDQDLMNLGH